MTTDCPGRIIDDRDNDLVDRLADGPAKRPMGDANALRPEHLGTRLRHIGTNRQNSSCHCHRSTGYHRRRNVASLQSHSRYRDCTFLESFPNTGVRDGSAQAWYQERELWQLGEIKLWRQIARDRIIARPTRAIGQIRLHPRTRLDFQYMANAGIFIFQDYTPRYTAILGPFFAQTRPTGSETLNVDRHELSSG